MSEENFRKVQILLMLIYAYFKKIFDHKKSINDLELEFIEKYGCGLRKINERMKKGMLFRLINKVRIFFR